MVIIGYLFYTPVVNPEPSAKRVPLEAVIKQLAELRTKELEFETKKEEPKPRKFTPNLPSQPQPKPKPGI